MTVPHPVPSSRVSRPALPPLPGSLRLVPAAVLASLAAGVLVAVPGWAPVAAAGAAAATGVLVLAGLRDRGRRGGWGVAAVSVGVVAVVALSVAGWSGSREPVALREAAASGRPVSVVVSVVSRVVEGRFRASVAGAPVLVLAPPAPTTPAATTPAPTTPDTPTPPAPTTPDPPTHPDTPTTPTTPPPIHIGATVALEVTVRAADPGDDVAFLLFAREPPSLRAPPPSLLAAVADLRERFLARSGSLPDPGGSLLPGLAIGETSRVSEPLDAAMRESSLSHLTAVSGANCAIVVGAGLALLAACGAPTLLRVGGAAVLLVGFVVLVTPEPSVVRAATMAALALAAVAVGRPLLGTPVLALAVVVLVVLDPWMSRSVGFALSVAATAGLLLLARPLADILGRILPGGLATVVSVPIAAQLACQPILLTLDPHVPLLAVPANLLAAPAAPVATVLGLLACLVDPLLPPVGAALAALGWLPASWIAAIAEFCASLPGARLPWPEGPWGVVAMAGLEAVALTAVLARSRVRRIAGRAAIAGIAVVVAAGAGGVLIPRLERPDWQFAMCDVGQGDATLVRSKGRIALVDTGPDPEALRACLDDLGIGRIDLLVLTHFDLDHVGGTGAVIGRVDRVLTGPTGEPADAGLLAALAEAGALVDAARVGDAGRLGDLAWRVLWPPPTGVGPGNPASVTLRWDCVVSRCLSALMLGDLGEEEQRRLAGASPPGVVDVVKVSHHGSADQSPALYSAIRATVGLIGVGADNRYGHPTVRLLGALADAGTRVLRTDRDGLILLAPGPGPREVDVWSSG